MLRGTALGSLSASCPAGARSSASFAAYTLEKRLAKTRSASARAPSKASPRPKSANNAGAQTSFIPMLTLGIPANA